MTKYTVTHDSATVREYEVEAETPDQAVEFVKEGKAKLVDSSSAETHRAREPRAMGAGAIKPNGIKSKETVETIVARMQHLTDDERIDVMSEFCRSCGGTNPRCHCWNDE